MLSHCSDYDQQWGRIESDEVSARTFGRAVQIFQGIRYDSYLYSPYVSIIFIFFFFFPTSLSSQFLTPVNKLLCVQESNTELKQVREYTNTA